MDLTDDNAVAREPLKQIITSKRVANKKLQKEKTKQEEFLRIFSAKPPPAKPRNAKGVKRRKVNEKFTTKSSQSILFGSRFNLGSAKKDVKPLPAQSEKNNGQCMMDPKPSRKPVSTKAFQNDLVIEQREDKVRNKSVK